jgi:hypothetical protein
MSDESGYDEDVTPPINKISDLVDQLADELHRAADHNGPVNPNMIKLIEAIQTQVQQVVM